MAEASTNGRGIVYVATGERYALEALNSFDTVRRWMPDVPVCIFTDLPEIARQRRFDRIEIIPDATRSIGDKIPPLRKTPYERTLFLDTDTFVCDNLEDLFPLLDKFDLAVAFEYWRTEFRCERLPPLYAAVNTGVVAYRMNPKMAAFMSDWWARYQAHVGEYPKKTDQPAFREALYDSDLRFFILPTEYNLRIHHPSFLGGHMGPKIIHDHDNPYLEEVRRRLAENQHPRIFGQISVSLISYWYFMKTRKVLRRWLREWRKGK
jgi:hypothetical protein